jgi:2-hydroxy fatty acid dioxygenase
MATVWDRIKDRFDLEKQVTFYMSYHYDKTNQYIHFTCIWPILITALMLAADLTPAFIATPEWLANLPLGAYFVFNLSAIGALVYMVWYIALDYM